MRWLRRLGGGHGPPYEAEPRFVVFALGHGHFQLLTALVAHDFEGQSLPWRIGAQDAQSMIGIVGLASVDANNDISILELQLLIPGGAHDQDACLGAEIFAQLRCDSDQFQVTPFAGQAEVDDWRWSRPIPDCSSFQSS